MGDTKTGGRCCNAPASFHRDAPAPQGASGGDPTSIRLLQHLPYAWRARELTVGGKGHPERGSIRGAGLRFSAFIHSASPRKRIVQLVFLQIFQPTDPFVQLVFLQTFQLTDLFKQQHRHAQRDSADAPSPHANYGGRFVTARYAPQ
jgi:hypothetical protein